MYRCVWSLAGRRRRSRRSTARWTAPASRATPTCRGRWTACGGRAPGWRIKCCVLVVGYYTLDRAPSFLESNFIPTTWRERERGHNPRRALKRRCSNPSCIEREDTIKAGARFLRCSRFGSRGASSSTPAVKGSKRRPVSSKVQPKCRENCAFST